MGATSRVTSAGGNALAEGRTLEAAAEATSSASAATVYTVLADLASHKEWGGVRGSKKVRLLTLDAPPGPAVLGTEFASTGADPMGTFSDTSVVTEAIPARLFEFVTEARLTPKRGGEPIEWTFVHRYEIAPDGAGSLISYRVRITRISRLPGILRLLGTRFAGIVMRMSASVGRRGVRNLAAVAEERSGR